MKSPNWYLLKTQLKTTYIAWLAMLQRTTSNKKGYEDVEVCERWKSSFNDFVNDVGLKPYNKSLSLDRIDPFGNYEPGNCRWATRQQQTLNKRLTRKETMDGVTKAFKLWCDDYEMNPVTVAKRMKVNNMSLEEALTARPYDLKENRKMTMIDAFGESHSYKYWSHKTGIPEKVLRRRITEKGWDNERALATPFDKRRSEIAKRAATRRKTTA